MTSKEHAPWCLDTAATLEVLQVDEQTGLTAPEVLRRQTQFGPNQLIATRQRAVLAILLAQFRSIVIWLLLLAAAVSFVFGEIPEAFAIVAVIIINATIGFVSELRAVRSIEALRHLGRVETTVRRDGRTQKVPAQSLVPGDVVLLEGGDVVSADMRIVDAVKLEADESTLTGESSPVAKGTDTLLLETHLTERSNMLFKGTVITRGAGVGIIASIGLATELGKISELVSEAEAEDTPLEKRLDALARRLVWLTAIIAAFVAISGIIGGRELLLAIEIAIALAVATIPEGLPIVATIALARGMWRMASRHALVARLSAVETLGATSVILADKTGTLTENRMTVTRIAVADTTLALSGSGLEIEGQLTSGEEAADQKDVVLAHEMLTLAALCNNASISVSAHDDSVAAVGDPTEVSLLVAARKLGISRKELLESLPEVREEPFDPATRAMATVHEDGETFLFAVKGAPEAVLEHCVSVRVNEGARALSDSERDQWFERSRQLGSEGLRTLAVATKRTENIGEAPYGALTLVGLVGFHDPPRVGVREALAACRDAGISVVMVTGDHPATAHSVAKDLDMLPAAQGESPVLDARTLPSFDSLTDADRDRLVNARVMARASPEQKLELIKLHQKRGHIVAMTGDGVNDAPALKKADIGVAMGKRGTQVAKESAAMILQDDRFETIVDAVAQGRAIYLNIRKFVIYLMSCNLSEILIVGLATLVNAPLPLLPLQILFLNLVTDVFPALALGVGEGSGQLMSRPPRQADEPILTHSHWWVISLYGVLMTFTVLAAMAMAYYVLDFDATRAVTVSFLTLAFSQLWHVFNMRDQSSHWLRNEITANRWVWGALLLCVLLILAAVYVPGLGALLSISHPGLNGWVLVLLMSAVPLALAPVVRLIPAPARFGKPQREAA